MAVPREGIHPVAEPSTESSVRALKGLIEQHLEARVDDDKRKDRSIKVIGLMATIIGLLSPVCVGSAVWYRGAITQEAETEEFRKETETFKTEATGEHWEIKKGIVENRKLILDGVDHISKTVEEAHAAEVRITARRRKPQPEPEPEFKIPELPESLRKARDQVNDLEMHQQLFQGDPLVLDGKKGRAK